MRIRILTPLLALIATVLLAACGGGHTSTSVKATATTTDDSATATASAGEAAGTPTAARTGVTLTLSHSHYGTQDTIVVTIHNGSGHTIWVADSRFGCSSVSLERHTSTGWVSLGTCSPRGSHWVAITTGAALKQQLTPMLGSEGNDSWPSGTFRAALIYRASSQPGAPASLSPAIHSATFTIS